MEERENPKRQRRRWWEVEAQPAVMAGGSGGNDLGGRQRCEAKAAVASTGLGDRREREPEEVELAVAGGGDAAGSGGERRQGRW